MSNRRDKDRGVLESTDTASADTAFFRRWSERKASANKDPMEIPDAAAREEVTTVADASPSPPLSDLDMPPIDALDEDSEYSGFLSPGVSEALRKLALRKLFQLPSFNVRDGLDDYDEDFTRFAPLGNVMTQDLRHRIETAAKRDAERQERPTANQEPAAGESMAEGDAPLVTHAEGPADSEGEEPSGGDPGGDDTGSDGRERG